MVHGRHVSDSIHLHFAAETYEVSLQINL